MLDRCVTGIFSCFPLLIREETQVFIASWKSKAMALQASCTTDSDSECRDETIALHLKLIAILSILFAGALGIALPLLGKKLMVLKTDGPFFTIVKAFAAGVILATGFVHILPNATAALTDSCLPDFPWQDFPFSGCIAMLAALCTLMVDVLGTEYYEKKHAKEREETQEDIGAAPSDVVVNNKDTKNMHVVGIHAHAASHSHILPSDGETLEHQHKLVIQESASSEDITAHSRHVVVSQVLELGIVTHSIIIGMSLGVSESPCTIRPLLAALSFHQFFEGFALGGCLSKAGFKSLSTMVMTIFFTLTTPFGIAVGACIASRFNASSPGALIVEGVFDSVSAGILIYMALVDLIAADFLNKRLSCTRALQILSYMSLFLGAASMSALAIWA